MALCVAFVDPEHPTASMCLCIDEEDPTPALRYAWVKSKELTTAFTDERDARKRGIDRCGVAEFRGNTKILHIMPHPDKKKLALKPLPKLRIG